MPEITWKTAKLGDLCSIKSGSSIKKDEYIQDGQYPVIGANGEIGRCNKINNDHPVITTGRVGTIGTVHMVNNAWISDNTLILDIVNNSINYTLLYYILMNLDFKSITTGNAQPLITQGRLKEQIIHYPVELQQQIRIATVLKDLDKLATLHKSKADILSKMKSQLMSNKTGIIEQERQKSEIPAGWVKVKVGDCLDYEQPTKYIVESTDYGDEYEIPVLTANKTFILGYTNETTGIYNKGNVIVFDDFTCDSKYVTFPFKVKSGAIKLLTAKPNIDLKFMSYILQTINIDTSVHKRYYIQQVAEQEILIPSTLQEQQRIAKILESYDGLIESQSQLIQIVERESSYRSNCSSVNNYTSSWRRVKLKDIVTISSGGSIKKSEYLESGEYQIIGANGCIGYTNKLNNTHPVLTTGRVGTIGTIHKVSDAWITDNTLILDIKDTNQVSYNYLYHILNTIDFKAITTGNAQPLITSGRLKEVEIWLPNLIEQQRISSLLDNYDEMIESQGHLIKIIEREREQLQKELLID